MPVEYLTNYESWDFDSNELPLRSPLYSLLPIGIGTPAVESFTSYLTRLAAAHGVSVTTLIRYKIAPLFIESSQATDLLSADIIRILMDASPKKPKTLLIQTAGFWLDLTQNASQLVCAVKTLTGRQDIHYTSLLSMQGWRLKFNNIFHFSQRWCPGCYSDWRHSGKPIYQPLLWALEPVTVCPHHQRYLQLRCHYCNGLQPFLILDKIQVGCCCMCGAWLGQILDSEANFKLPDLVWDLWVAQVLGKLLAKTDVLVTNPARKETRSRECPIFNSLNWFLRQCYQIGINPVECLSNF